MRINRAANNTLVRARCQIREGAWWMVKTSKWKWAYFHVSRILEMSKRRLRR